MNDLIHISIKRFNIEFDINTDWFIYIPFIGWLHAFAFKKESYFAMHHAKQGFVLAVAFIVIPTVLTFSRLIFPESLRIVKFILVILVYISHFIYFIICIWGTIKVVKKERYEFPIIDRYIHYINVN